MIKFFRKIRQRLLTENKFSKYLLYAIGEIILVVLGILIALSINNKNKQKINDTKITNILKEIQQDLVSDVERSKEIFDYHIWVDSIQDLILNNKYTYDDYKSGNARELGYNYLDFVINTNGYDNLMRNIDNVPEKYQPLLDDLKDLYVKKKSTIEVSNTRIRETAYKNIDGLERHNWTLQYFRGLRPDEAINYYLNNSEYKNKLITYLNGLGNTFFISQSYRSKAIETYLKIKELTKSTDSIPKTFGLEPKNKTYLNTIVGIYKIKDSLGRGWSKEIKIRNEGTELLYIDGDFESELVHHVASVYYIVRTRHYLKYNTPNEGELYISYSFFGNATYTKVE